MPHVWELYRRFEGIVLDVCEPVKIIPQQTRVAIQDRVRFINAAPRKSYLQVDLPPEIRSRSDVRLGRTQKGGEMPGKKHTPEQIIAKLRQAEVAMSTGSTVVEAVRQIEVTEQTFYRWRNEYGGLSIDQAKRLKQIEAENSRLKRAIADLTLDNQILKEAAEGNF